MVYVQRDVLQVADEGAAGVVAAMDTVAAAASAGAAAAGV